MKKFDYSNMNVSMWPVLSEEQNKIVDLINRNLEKCHLSARERAEAHRLVVFALSKESNE